MKPRDGLTTPIWTDSNDYPTFSPPPSSGHAEVLIVGGGIAGLTAAYLLAKEGRRVTLIDAGAIGEGQTGRTSAHLASAIDDRFFEVERLRGQEVARLAYESHAAAIDTIEWIARDEKIDCDFRRLDGYLFPATRDDASVIEKEFDAAKRIGFAGVERVADVPTLSVTGPAIRFPNQARFEPLAYIVGLANACERLGVTIHTGKYVTAITPPKDGKPSQATIGEQEGTWTADHIISTTNVPSGVGSGTRFYLKQAPYRTYVVGIELREGSVADALYWDTLDPYHYVRVREFGGRSTLLVGGEDHKVGQTGASEERFAALEAWARGRFAGLGEVVSKWSGQVQEPGDGLGLIGKVADGVYVVTGDSGMGLTHGTLGAILIADQIAGRPNPWVDVYDPNRKEFNLDTAKEDAKAAAQYVDHLTPGEARSVDEIPPGSGAVVREGLSKYAIFKDVDGTVTKCSAICNHMGCIVHWNGVEKSWDCPCHGSRFDAKGRLVVGPAVKDLAKAE